MLLVGYINACYVSVYDNNRPSDGFVVERSAFVVYKTEYILHGMKKHHMEIFQPVKMLWPVVEKLTNDM